MSPVIQPRTCRPPAGAADVMDSSRDSRGIDVPESPCVAERSEKEEPSMKSTTIAVDVAKEVLEVAVSVRPGQISEQKRLLGTDPDERPRPDVLEHAQQLRYKRAQRLDAIGSGSKRHDRQI